MMLFDLHLHTARHSPDSRTDPFELLDRARAAGLHGVVLTEHHYIWPERELEELRTAAPDLVILSGVEVTGNGGDVLVYGVTDNAAVPRGLDWPDLLRAVHDLGGAAVLAHPYRWDQPVDELLEEPGVRFDGVELMSHNMDADLRHKAAALFARHPEWAGLGNSDSHAPETVGVCRTAFATDVRTNADLVRAIRERRTRAVEQG